MSKNSLMERMIINGVNIHNSQEVFDFFHKAIMNEGGTSGGLSIEEVEGFFNRWIAGLAKTVNDMALGKADVDSLEVINISITNISKIIQSLINSIEEINPPSIDIEHIQQSITLMLEGISSIQLNIEGLESSIESLELSKADQSEFTALSKAYALDLKGTNEQINNLGLDLTNIANNVADTKRDIESILDNILGG